MTRSRTGVRYTGTHWPSVSVPVPPRSIGGVFPPAGGWSGKAGRIIHDWRPRVASRG